MISIACSIDKKCIYYYNHATNLCSLPKAVIFFSFFGKKKNSSFQLEITRPVLGAVDVEVFEINGNHYLAVAEYAAGQKPLEGSSIYKIVEKQGEKIELEFVQMLNTRNARDITVW